MRWLILLGTLTLWLACMSLIYVNFCPKEVQMDALPGAKTALNALFDEEAESEREWALYINLQPPLPGAPKAGARAAWDGVSEQNLREIGNLYTLLLRPHFSRAEQHTRLTLALPLEENPEIMKKFGHVCYTCDASFSREQGLETCKSDLICGPINVTSWGVRDGGIINLTTQFGPGDKRLPSQLTKIPVGSCAAPNLELLPFQKNRDIRKGYSWPLVMLDTTSVLEDAAEPKIVQVQAVCTGSTEIFFGGKLVRVFEAATEDGQARAWYSADGLVLKQAYTLFNLLEVMVVRREIGPRKKGAPQQALSPRGHGEKN